MVDDETGLITEGTFAAAPLNFSFDITSPIETTIYVNARFTQITPGAVTSAVVTKLSEAEAEVSIGMDVRVDLHIEVGRPAQIDADCVATPVSLRLTSTVPYDYDSGRVTLQDADFRVPPVPVTQRCIDIIANGVNERLAGGGHSLTMTMQGEIPRLRIGVYETTTALDVAPTSSREGDEVTLSAQVTPEPGPDLPDEPLGGLVEFRDGGTVVGSVPVDAGGEATLTTSDLPAGRRALTAVYKGDEVYAPSTSAALSYLVAAAPTVTLPETIPAVVIEGNPRPFTATLANPTDIGAPIDEARLDVTIARFAPPAPTNAVLTPDRITLEYFDGSTWIPVPLTETSPRVLQGSVTGIDLAVGEQRNVRFRVRAFAVGTTVHATNCNADNPTCPGPLTVNTALVADDESRTFATDEAPLDMVEKTRRATTVAFGGGNPQPHTVRQGFSILLPMQLSPNFGSVPWSGVAEAYIDGVQVPTHNPNLPFEDNPADQFAVTSASSRIWVTLPANIDPGSHQVTLRYLGDPFHGPGEVTSTFSVLERLPQAHPFVCRDRTLTGQTFEFGANVVFDAEGLPTVAPAGTEVPFTVDDARLLLQRPVGVGPAQTLVVPDFRTVTFDLASRGTASGTEMTKTGTTPLPPSPKPALEPTVDQTHGFPGVTGTVTVAGAPGDVVPVELTDLVISRSEFGLLVDITCTAQGGPMVLGEVLAAGVSVSASPAGPVREGVDVRMDAMTFPADAAGTVAFSSDRDGSLGPPVAVDQGSVAITVDNLSPGAHVVTAAFNAIDPAVPDTAGTTSVTVLPRYDCPAFAQSGNAAVVRLVYLELLGRCPDQAGFDYWKGRLDRGTSREVFAGAIARAPEAVGRVVDDAYQTMLGRAPDAEGRAFWVRRLQASGRYDALLAELGASGEFWSKAGSSNDGFVTRVYERLLNRAPDDGGLTYWTGRLNQGTSRRALILALANLDEPVRRLVDAAYGEILARTPTATERTSGIGFLRRNGDRSALYAQLMNRAEFVTRAGQFPNQES